jgi:hypothetical protein
MYNIDGAPIIAQAKQLVEKLSSGITEWKSAGMVLEEPGPSSFAMESTFNPEAVEVEETSERKEAETRGIPPEEEGIRR